MKQSILFENGKLYVVELPEKPTVCHNKCSKLQECSCDWLTVVYENRRDAALANKVEVKNPEVIVKGGTHGILFNLDNKQLLDGDTFPLPDGIEVEIKKDGNLFSCLNRDIAILKRIEPEKILINTNWAETLKCAEAYTFEPMHPNPTDFDAIDNFLKSPEKPEENLDDKIELLDWELIMSESRRFYDHTPESFKNMLQRFRRLGFTIQRKKS